MLSTLAFHNDRSPINCFWRLNIFLARRIQTATSESEFLYTLTTVGSSYQATGTTQEDFFNVKAHVPHSVTAKRQEAPQLQYQTITLHGAVSASGITPIRAHSDSVLLSSPQQIR